jgi:sporulation protein YlmC with PRC-barrel domain
MNLTRLAHHQHPRPPHQELRQKSVFDSGVRHVGQVENLYVDDDMNLQFVDVAVSGLLGFGKKHYLVPVEAIAEEAPGSITLTVDQQTVESAPTLGDPHTAQDENLQRAARQQSAWDRWEDKA